MKRWCSTKVKTQQHASGTKSKLSSPLQWAGVIHPQEGREGGRGKKQSSVPFSSLPMTFFSFLLLYSSPRVLSLLPHSFPFAHDSCREVSSNKPQLLSLQMSFCQLPKDFADHCMGDPTNSINVFILKKRCTFNWKPCFSFVCIFCKKEKETTNWKKKKKNKRKTCFRVREHTCVCLRYKMTVLFHNRCKQERSGKSLPWRIQRGRNMWLVGPLGCLAWLGERVGRKIKWNGDKLSRACKFRQETGEWFELDAVWAILEWYWLMNCSWKHLNRRRRKEFLENVLPHTGICSSEVAREDSSHLICGLA